MNKEPLSEFRTFGPTPSIITTQHHTAQAHDRFGLAQRKAHIIVGCWKINNRPY